MIDREKIEGAAKEVFEANAKLDASIYHAKLIDEFLKRDLTFYTSEPTDEGNKKFYEVNCEEDGSTSWEAVDDVEPFYSFLVGEELEVWVSTEDEIPERTRDELKEYVKSSEVWLTVPDDLSRGVIINFPKQGEEPEFYWYKQE